MASTGCDKESGTQSKVPLRAPAGPEVYPRSWQTLEPGVGPAVTQLHFPSSSLLLQLWMANVQDLEEIREVLWLSRVSGVECVNRKDETCNSLQCSGGARRGIATWCTWTRSSCCRRHMNQVTLGTALWIHEGLPSLHPQQALELTQVISWITYIPCCPFLLLVVLLLCVRTGCKGKKTKGAEWIHRSSALELVFFVIPVRKALRLCKVLIKMPFIEGKTRRKKRII